VNEEIWKCSTKTLEFKVPAQREKRVAEVNT